MKKLFQFTTLAATAILFAANALGDTIGLWTFETSPPADLTDSATISGISADVGSGTASGVHASAVSDWTTPAGNGSANSLSVNTWGVGDYFQFQVSTIGFSGIGVSFDQTSSSTGPRDFDLRYSTDGSSFTTFSGYTVLGNGTTPNPSWNNATASSAYSYFFNLSSVTAINNASTIYFRLVDTSTTSAGGGTVGTGGTDRVDNFHVFSPVPEPSSMALTGLGLLALAFRRRK